MDNNSSTTSGKRGTVVEELMLFLDEKVGVPTTAMGDDDDKRAGHYTVEMHDRERGGERETSFFMKDKRSAPLGRPSMLLECSVLGSCALPAYLQRLYKRTFPLLGTPLGNIILRMYTIPYM